MQNIKMTQKDSILTITVDLSQKGTASASGKTEVIATTRGNVQAPNDSAIKIGLNVYRKP